MEVKSVGNIKALKEFAISELQEEEEIEEIIVLAAAAGIDAALLKNDPKVLEALAKRGRHSKADAKRISEMNDHVESMGDHVEKIAKMHKGMTETHAKMAET